MFYGIVAIIGRPNVGKSTLFNRLTHSRGAIVADQAGITRDRIYGSVFYSADKDSGFTLVDTGGFETKGFNLQPFAKNLVWEQSERAIQDADLVILLLDGKHGLHHHDRELMQFLRKEKKNVLYVVNKIDAVEQKSAMMEFYAMGEDKLIALSAAHRYGVKDLLSEINDKLSSLKESADSKMKAQKMLEKEGARNIALIGRPNAGKSSVLNRLLGEERSLVSDVAGTTRDSVRSSFQFKSKTYNILDTAGIRRRTKVKDYIEVKSVFASLKAIEGAEVILYVIDALEGIKDQDARLINLAMERHKPILLLVNKWDLVEDKDSNTSRDYERNIKRMFPFCQMHFISCLTNQRVHKMMPIIETLFEQYERRVPTSEVNRCLESLIQAHVHPHVNGKALRFYYATQQASAPPSFVLMCNADKKAVHESYKRYMMKSFQNELGFGKVPIRFMFRNKNKPQKKNARMKMPDDIEEINVNV